MRFLLSIHDVWPGNFRLVAEYLHRLRSLGVNQFALLVVPFYQGRQKMEAAEEFLAWVRQEADSGCEIFLHGYYHLKPEKVAGACLLEKRSPWGNWINRKWVNDEAEFCGLGHTDVNQLLKRGLAAFKAGELPCLGFVAPTWHGNPSQDQLLGHPFKLVESRFFIRHLEKKVHFFAPPLAWNQPQGREPCLAGGAIWLQTLLKLPLIKVAIHPGDFAGSDTLKVLGKVIASGQNMSYSGLFAD